MGFLSMIGLMTVAEHDRLSDNRVERLTTSLESKDETIERLLSERDGARRDAVARSTEISEIRVLLADARLIAEQYRPDAQKWRDRAAREHARRTKTRSPTPKPVAAKVKRGAGK